MTKAKTKAAVRVIKEIKEIKAEVKVTKVTSHKHMKFEAMWACDILSTHYSKARKERQSAEMYVRSLEIHKTLLISE